MTVLNFARGNGVLQARLDYAARGWHTFPIPPGTKQSHKSAAHSNGRKWGRTVDPAEIQSDAARWPDANVGIACGPLSGFWVCEADTAEGHAVDGIASLRQLEATHGALPPTLMAISPSGSLHYYFNWPTDVTIKNSASRIAPGVDVRGDGGMVVAPPSVKDGACYRWLNEGTPIADAPQWLIDKAVQASRRASSSSRQRQQQADIEKLRAALRVIPNENLNWEDWNNLVMAIYSATGGSNAGLTLAHEWSSKAQKYDAANTDAKWQALHGTPPTSIGVGSIYYKATEACPGWDQVAIADFRAYMPMHNYIFIPTRDLWPATSVNAKLRPVKLFNADGTPDMDGDKQKTMSATAWLDKYQSVEQMTWAPGLPMVMQDRLIADGGWIDRLGVACFNLYRPPTIVHGDASKAGKWTEHVKRVYPADHGHIIKWLAQRVQHAEDKINHALVLGGAPGIGKDTLLEPAKETIGHWNFKEVSPEQLLGRFNGFLKSVILRVSEARDLGEHNRYQLYEHLKNYTAAPPDVLLVDEKHLREYSVLNVCGVVITTNHKSDGIYLPYDDRRHFVAWSDAVASDFADDYWTDIYGWYREEGTAHVAAYLATLDIGDFDCKAPPPKTPAFWAIVDANRAPENAELEDVLDRLSESDNDSPRNLIRPAIITLDDLICFAQGEFKSWLQDRRNRKAIPHRLEACGYVPVRNQDSKQGLWFLCNKAGTWSKRMVVYARDDLSVRDQIAAVGRYTLPL